jgi:hypothetical protein
VASSVAAVQAVSEGTVMHNFVIEHHTCPHCRNLRTVRFGAISFCFNCRSKLSGSPPNTPKPVTSFAFTAAEQARLQIYRNAIRAGFYTDYLPLVGA